MTTHPTCQVCGRAIKVLQGFASNDFGRVNKVSIIAHHGYQRPGGGWQTASCMGARRLPYEVAHDALDEAIESCGEHVKHLQKVLKEHVEQPPETLTQSSRHPYETYEPQPRPADFDPLAEHHPSYMPVRSYADLWHAKAVSLEMNSVHTQQTLHILQERRRAWKEHP